MRKLILSLLVAFAVGGFGLPASLQTPASPPQKGGVGDITGAYQVDPKWPQWAHPYPKQGYIWGSQGGVFAESPDRIYLATRGELKLPEKTPPSPLNLIPGPFPGYWGAIGLPASQQLVDSMANTIVVVDGDGKLIESWTQWDKLFEFTRGPHGVYISPYDPERHVWIVDDIGHAIYKFSHDGKRLVQTLGIPGEMGDNEDLTRLRRPTAIAWFPEGTFVVSDGYSNARVVKFDKSGKPLMKWGSRGKGPGQFSTPHSIAVGPDRRVYVGDRGNARIQVFAENGKFFAEWPGVAANSLFISKDQSLWAADLPTNRIVKYDLKGIVQEAWGAPGVHPGAIWCGHQIAPDSNGNLYVAECFTGRTQKFRPKPGANQARLAWAVPLMPMAGSSGN